MGDAFSALADYAGYYRAIATVLRAAVSSMKSTEAREELASLASDYENLASYVESSQSCEPPRGLASGSPGALSESLPPAQ